MNNNEFDEEVLSHHLNSKVDTIFVDQPCSFQSGPYVTKITLGLDDNDGTDFPRPVVTIAMPTVNVIRMVEDLQKVLQSHDFKLHNLKTIQDDLKNHYGDSSTVTPLKKIRRVKDK